MADDWRNRLGDVSQWSDFDPITTSDILSAMKPPSLMDRLAQLHRDYIQPMGSAALAKQEPNWFGKNILANIPEGAAMAANFLTPAARVPIPRISNPIKAYHGSPHDFNEFSLSKIGTGEGAQAYGHGLYFAEHEPVAKGYRDALSGPNNGWSSAPEPSGQNAGLYRATSRYPGTGRDLGAIKEHRYFPTEAEAKAWALAEAEQWPQGKMYEVALHATPEQFLDWDKPLAGQPPAVREGIASALEKARGKPVNDDFYGQFGTSGEALHNLVSAWSKHNPEGTSGALREAGIPGIRYLDQGSRGAGSGTSNYVVFYPSIIEILRKYGLVGPAALGAANALSQDQAPQQ